MSNYTSRKSESDNSLSNSNNDENACVVCFKNVQTYSVGECDHPVCYECSTRMRVLCQQNECPICRQDLQKVIFTSDVMPYRQLEIECRTGPYEKRYRIIFGSLQIQKQFNHLLDHPCPQCENLTFPSFDALKDHVRKSHELFYCELCTENLKIFSFERRCYNREELSLHRRKGDPDNTSHRGHPLCKYCNCRYLDRDELFRHLRREHYYCHFCDADGSNQFYDDYESLREHFKAEHYICEEGDCAQEKFTAVFRSDIDLRAHKASMHGKHLGKVATKQARTLEFEFTLAPRNSRNNHQNGSDGSRGSHAHSMRIRNDPQMEFEIEDRSSMYMQNPQKMIDHKNEAEFPSLGGGSGSTAVHLVRPNVSISAKSFRSSGFAKTKENFPALGGENSALDPGPSLASTFHTKNTASSILRQSSAPASNNGTSQTKSSGSGGMVIHVSNRPTSTTQPSTTTLSSKRNSENTGKNSMNDFPALPGSNKNSRYLDLAEPSPPRIPINLNSVSAKHKSLVVDNYVPLTTSIGTKFNLIRKDATSSEVLGQPSPNKKPVSAGPLVVNPPKLSSKDNFPELSTPSNSNSNASSALFQQPQWGASLKQKTESKRLKVAPAPILHDSKTVSSGTNGMTSNNNNNKVSQLNKTDGKKKQIKLIDSSITQGNSSVKSNNKSTSKESNNNTNINKKFSDLNIVNDFPSLGGSSASSKPTPPPGFENKSSNKAAVPPPPGFNKVILNSVARPNQNNLTFTTSLGESFNILPAHKFRPPPNAGKRNQILVMNFQQVLNPDVMDEFRRISQLFKDGIYNTEPYYDHCKAALGEKFEEIFPELLALLPDINKQQELYLVHSQKIKEALKNKKNRSQFKVPKLEVCSTCKQVLVSNDLLAHIQNHELENNFPTLSDKNTSSSSTKTSITTHK